MKTTTQSGSEAWLCDSVPTETQLRSLLAPYKRSDGHVIALLVTPMPGATAIANFDSTVWPAWIRSAIKKWLLERGGVPSALPLEIVRNSEGKLFVQPVTKLGTRSTVSHAEPVTDDDAPQSKDT